MYITEEYLESLRTKKGGYTKKNLKKLGINWPPRKGWKKQLIGKQIFKRAKKPIQKRKHQALKLAESQIKQQNPNELKFRKLLIEFGIKHIYQKPFYCEYRVCCVDFYFPKNNIVIEIDGENHYTESAKHNDLDRTKYLKETHGVKDLLRVTNKQVANEIDTVREIVLDWLD